MIDESTNLLRQKKDLASAEMQKVFEEIMTGQAETGQIVSFLLALSAKGETVEEITAAAEVMRKHAIKIRVDKDVVLDTCGTGGDCQGTFNISTVVAFIAAGCGITVAKHGNRSVSSFCGSADILEELGVVINMTPDRAEGALREVGISFLFAPQFHPAMKYAMPARKEIKKRTIFNILGPLTNPAGATHQLMGVYDGQLTDKLARVLVNLGSRHALVVHGHDGLDEVSTADETKISEAKDGKVHTYVISPDDFGFPRSRLEDIKGAGARENAAAIMRLLEGEKGSYRNIVLLNAAAAVYTADKAGSIKEGLSLAQEALDSGKALKKLEELRRYSIK